MQGTVDSAIAELRGIVGVKSNAELARQLKHDKSDLTAWRSRGRMPEKYQTFLQQVRSGVPLQELDVWPELREAGTRVALVRFTILRQQLVQGKM
jgi:hypothetical protein